MRLYFFDRFTVQCNKQMQYAMCRRMLRSYINYQIALLCCGYLFKHGLSFVVCCLLACRSLSEGRLFVVCCLLACRSLSEGRSFVVMLCEFLQLNHVHWIFIIFAQRPSFPVIGHKQPSQVGMIIEFHSKKVIC